jgi:hypothetical protein
MKASKLGRGIVRAAFIGLTLATTACLYSAPPVDNLPPEPTPAGRACTPTAPGSCGAATSPTGTPIYGVPVGYRPP